MVKQGYGCGGKLLCGSKIMLFVHSSVDDRALRSPHACPLDGCSSLAARPLPSLDSHLRNLTRLERAGLVTQDINQRWYAGPLTTDLLREHYEMRWLLEPIALGQAHGKLTMADLQAKYDRISAA